MSEQRTAYNMIGVTAATLVQMVVQLLYFTTLTSYWGASDETDALSAALVIPTVWAAIITGSLAYVLVPELSAKLSDSRESLTAWRLASYVGVVTALMSLVVTVGLYFGADVICSAYDNFPIEKQALTAKILRILSVQVVLTGLISWAAAVHNSVHSFLVPALGGVIGTAFVLLLVRLFGAQDILYFAWAINLGSVVSIAVHLTPIASRLGKPIANTQNVLRLAHRFWPLILGTAFLRIDPFIDRLWASELDAGSTSLITYAHRILSVLLMIGASSLSLVVFPQLSDRLAKEGKQGFIEHFSLAMRRLVLLIAPIAIGVSVFSEQIIRDLFLNDEFTVADVAATAGLVVVMMGMFVGASLGELLARGFYVLADTVTPTLIGVISLIIGLVAKYVLFQLFDLKGIGLGISVYFMLSALVMAVVLTKRFSGNPFSGSLGYAVQAGVASAIACVCCSVVFATTLGVTWFAAPVGAVTYFAALLCLRNAEAWQAVDVLKVRLKVGKRQ